MRFEQHPCALWLHTMSSSYQDGGDRTAMQYEPLGKELENLVLAFLRKPSLSGDTQFDLMKVHLHYLRRKRCRKVLCELSVFFLQRAR
jgi:hypothetical protein